MASIQIGKACKRADFESRFADAEGWPICRPFLQAIRSDVLSDKLSARSMASKVSAPPARPDACGGARMSAAFKAGVVQCENFGQFLIGRCFLGARKIFCTLGMAPNLLRLSAVLRERQFLL